MSNEFTSFDEMHQGTTVSQPYEDLASWLAGRPLDDLYLKAREAENLFRRIGITFAVYGDTTNAERLIPFDLIPRIFSAVEWDRIDRGVKQRARALNMFIADIYNEQAVLNDGIVPRDMILQNEAYVEQMQGVTPPGGIFAHIIGTDLVRTGPNDFYVLEDNCRTPSGVSYMLENRAIMTRLFPELFDQIPVRPVSDYGAALRDTLYDVAPPACSGTPTLAILTPGSYNSAYYEHSFLADEMGIPLVMGSDLTVENGRVYMRTTMGLRAVDVLYRRIDDAFLDPLTFRADSMLGVPGLFEAYKNGGVTLVNAPGTGIADDKAIYCFIPEIIQYYLGEAPILPNVPTLRCGIADECAEALSKMNELVFKQVHGSGGYGMLIGPRATAAEIEDYRAQVLAEPANFVAQPTLALSTAPTLLQDGLVPRHIDFRPFVLSGKETRLVPGGLTRVAMNEGSLVVNSSQGGGVKDTWVLSK